MKAFKAFLYGCIIKEMLIVIARLLQLLFHLNDLAHLINQVLHTDIFRTVSKIGMYRLLCFWPIHFWTCLSGGFQVYPLDKWQLVYVIVFKCIHVQQTFTCSMPTIETTEKGVKYVLS